jgi:hypothetical protein
MDLIGAQTVNTISDDWMQHVGSTAPSNSYTLTTALINN